jgi:Kef-type K+ transport system membrane component KefB
MKKSKRSLTFISILIGLVIVMVPPVVQAASEGGEGGHGGAGITFLLIAMLLLAAKFSSLIERFGQPAVLGELVVGVILGNLGLLGLHFFEPAKTDPIINFLAQLGVVILLFQIGLESKIEEMRQVGVRAGLVAVVGVVAPFVLGTYVVGPLLLPGLSGNAYLFLGAALTATSVGITARVFRDLGKLQSPEAKIVLGAAVIDDVLGLIVLAVVSAIVTSGAVSLATVSWIFAKSVLFLVGAIGVGHLLAPRIGKIFSRINAGIGMKFALVISFCLIFAYLAELIGLAAIVGAFAAGLVLEPVHFRNFKDPDIFDDILKSLRYSDPDEIVSILEVMDDHSERHTEDLIEPVGHFFVPLFFVITGMAVQLETLLDPSILLVALGVTIFAFASKLVAGLVAGPVQKSLVGWGMVPRGEVGLIFATIGRSLGVVSAEVFSVIVIMVILTTLLTPPVLSSLIKRTGDRSQSKPKTLEGLATRHPIFSIFFGD